MEIVDQDRMMDRDPTLLPELVAPNLRLVQGLTKPVHMLDYEGNHE